MNEKRLVALIPGEPGRVCLMILLDLKRFRSRVGCLRVRTQVIETLQVLETLIMNLTASRRHCTPRIEQLVGPAMTSWGQKQNRSSFRRGLEIALNCAVLIASWPIILGVVYGYVASSRSPQSSLAIVPKGAKLKISGVEWSDLNTQLYWL